jgi:hypothetical protein
VVGILLFLWPDTQPRAWIKGSWYLRFRFWVVVRRRRRWRRRRWPVTAIFSGRLKSEVVRSLQSLRLLWEEEWGSCFLTNEALKRFSAGFRRKGLPHWEKLVFQRWASSPGPSELLFILAPHFRMGDPCSFYFIFILFYYYLLYISIGLFFLGPYWFFLEC